MYKNLGILAYDLRVDDKEFVMREFKRNGNTAKRKWVGREVSALTNAVKPSI